jgi:hypothetical protein
MSLADHFANRIQEEEFEEKERRVPTVARLAEVFRSASEAVS